MPRHSQLHPRPGTAYRAFTLIELLVVVGIIALLVGILLPALAAARDATKLTTCSSRLHELGVGIHSYATDYKFYIPCGPSTGNDPNVSYGLPAPTAPAQTYNWYNIATSQTWIGDNAVLGPGITPANSPQQTYNGIGVLMSNAAYINDPNAYYCPGDENIKVPTEISRIGSNMDSFCSYIYRQLDQTTASKIDDLGDNNPSGFAATNPNYVGVSAKPKILAMDRMSNLSITNGVRVNHNNKFVNILELPGHVIRTPEVSNRLAVTNIAFSITVPVRLDEMIRNADAIEDNGISNVPFP